MGMKKPPIIFKITPLDLLTILFIGLKLTHYINWSWWWVLLPQWWVFVPIILTAIVGFIGLAFVFCKRVRLRMKGELT
jgi:hypothetical protein